MKILVLYTTFPNESQAEEMINAMLDKKLIACANAHSVTSHYTWGQKRIRNPEIVVRLKTSLHRLESCMEHIRNEHQYDTPCLWWEEVNCSSEYGQWVLQQTS